MKIVVIADIHSNIFYFKEILKRIDEEKPDKVYCLGDLVGYYDDPNGVINLVREKGIISVKGNHEKYLLTEMNYDTENESIYRIREQLSLISKDNINYLKTLPDYIDLEIRGKKICLTHSLPNDTHTYLYNPENLQKKFLINFDYYFYGHTHLPLISYQYGVCVINPGSVGQPRDYTRKPSFSIVDFYNEKISIKKVKVSFDNYISMLKEQNYDKRVIDVLLRSYDEEN